MQIIFKNFLVGKTDSMIMLKSVGTKNKLFAKDSAFSEGILDSEEITKWIIKHKRNV